MQDEQHIESSSTLAEQKERERLNLARSILKEAVINAGIKDISEYKGEPLTNRWHVFSANHGEDVVLRMYVQGIFGVINADVSLVHAAGWAIDETELVLNRPDAKEPNDTTALQAARSFIPPSVRLPAFGRKPEPLVVGQFHS